MTKLAQYMVAVALGAATLGLFQNFTSTPISPFTLRAGESKFFSNNQLELIMQGDGNLVLYKGSKPLWATSTATGQPQAYSCGSKCSAILQDNGKFYLHGGTQDRVLNLGGEQLTGAKLLVSDKAPFVKITDAQGVQIWPAVAVVLSAVDLVFYRDYKVKYVVTDHGREVGHDFYTYADYEMTFANMKDASTFSRVTLENNGSHFRYNGLTGQHQIDLQLNFQACRATFVSLRTIDDKQVMYEVLLNPRDPSINASISGYFVNGVSYHVTTHPSNFDRDGHYAKQLDSCKYSSKPPFYGGTVTID